MSQRRMRSHVRCVFACDVPVPTQFGYEVNFLWMCYIVFNIVDQWKKKSSFTDMRDKFALTAVDIYSSVYDSTVVEAAKVAADASNSKMMKTRKVSASIAGAEPLAKKRRRTAKAKQAAAPASATTPLVKFKFNVAGGIIHTPITITEYANELNETRVAGHQTAGVHTRYQNESTVYVIEKIGAKTVIIGKAEILAMPGLKVAQGQFISSPKLAIHDTATGTAPQAFEIQEVSSRNTRHDGRFACAVNAYDWFFSSHDLHSARFVSFCLCSNQGAVIVAIRALRLGLRDANSLSFDPLTSSKIACTDMHDGVAPIITATKKAHPESQTLGDVMKGFLVSRCAAQIDCSLSNRDRARLVFDVLASMTPATVVCKCWCFVVGDGLHQ